MDAGLALARQQALDLTDEKDFLYGKLLGGLGVDVIKSRKAWVKLPLAMPPITWR